ncbi:TRAPP trafficking subunit Trs65-domain-containing protein [Trametes gibbosa]|nr:TRAPP trafficking subunit Trs65-domain-containing protein [Trametes gibbosa]
MGSYEDLFEASVLEVVAPQPSLEFPVDYKADQAQDWLARLRGPSGDRRTAFFDENLDFLLTIRLPSTASDDQSTPEPPKSLLSFLVHLQISYETSYISPSAVAPDVSSTARLSMPPPPRNSSMQRNRPGPLLAGHPSIFPPHTPHPIPAAAESDIKYVQSQGTPLVSAIWGESESRDSEQFALLWDESECCWLAVYKMSILVLFMLTKVSDPLLCITVSTTLRNKPLAITPPRQTLAALIESAGGLKSAGLYSPVKANGDASDQHSNSGDSDDDELLSGLQEVNLLEGLSAGPTFADPKEALSLPSSRLGMNTRMHEFSLGPPSSASASTPIPYATGIASPPASGTLPRAATLRKSFRKTLKTLSGFRVRMRTVFVPYFLLPQGTDGARTRKSRHTKTAFGNDHSDSDSDATDSDLDDDILQEQEQREAGNEEHTVVLSVEIENVFAEAYASSASGVPAYHFEVERADVTVGGSGARTALVGWGEHGSKDVFPLRIAPREQVNLLYAVSFLRGPEVDEFSLARPPGLDGKNASNDELQRAVSINISGRPYEQDSSSGELSSAYPTRLYPSKWNCVLDLSSSSVSATKHKQKRESGGVDANGNDNFVLPTPASPFPTAPAPPTRSLTPLTTRSVVPLTAVAGSKRHTLAAIDTPAAEYARNLPSLKSPMNYQSSTSMLNPANQPPSAPLHSSPTPTGFNTGGVQTLNIPSHRASSYIPPSVAFQTTFPRSPTTYGAPTSPPLPLPPSNLNPLAITYTHTQSDSVSTINEVLDPATPVPSPPFIPPPLRTPAYPAYPSSPSPVPPTPFWQTPIAQQSGGGAVNVGPSVEIRRDRGAGGAGGGIPPTPGPTVGGFGFGGMQSLQHAVSGGDARADRQSGYYGGEDVASGGEPIVVSVGLLSPAPRQPKAHAGAGRLFPLDKFTLDIFVFNQSSWTRRFEVSFPEERRRRRMHGATTSQGGQKRGEEAHPPGIIPLENRVRIGPLLPSTCQSVRMDFLALAPGVHAIDTLTLTDIQTGYAMNLRSVIDVIVHEPDSSIAGDSPE